MLHTKSNPDKESDAIGMLLLPVLELLSCGMFIKSLAERIFHLGSATEEIAFHVLFLPH